MTLDLNPSLRLRRADGKGSLYHLYHGPILLVAAKAVTIPLGKFRVVVTRVAASKRGGGVVTVVRLFALKDGSLIAELHP